MGITYLVSPLRRHLHSPVTATLMVMTLETHLLGLELGRDFGFAIAVCLGLSGSRSPLTYPLQLLLHAGLLLLQLA